MPHHTSHGSAVPPGGRRARRLGLGVLAAAGLLGGLLTAPAVSASPTGPLAELITNGDFSGKNHEPWWFTENSPASVVDGQLCAEVPADTEEVWDAIVGQDGVSLTEGEEYTLTYTVSATARHTVTTHVQEAVDPWGAQFSSQDAVSTRARTYSHTFTAEADDPEAQLVFQIGGSSRAYTFCLDDVSLTDES
ncbi:hypothetical protein CUT44_23440 [Streptomyces carminius]|uniref:CBM-cenC domain-containing protein n=1 Tax=Streptomyces carminius TaxID=2665496 RepID=A0A2M8LTI5_9ACTN|nr:carbohydrate binding domain-containing protein [Streptomyces carminius]PJE95272.1 hypothetical protein CUT44_23440 [Streptomyces carminius]